ncbi:hydantoinase B/oxoprolinase family protein [Ketogulonicigenium vulgare]|uniref:5-oxoprolinase (ATP-hydrolyzing) n=1 Tax=Ketogulonicigenium vulgare (strain WSH-001) TaxID=759362 RepID=F9Y7Y0_KETVW|nr:hydantoinase B/oxoprolinase family protein [Ketogulonicigenium vulgare]ADO42919.1 putative N-methylhydantoinase B [Ketogulonicigenium vulgare Y25]AEM41106.1 5-oxoprolinase (ATP-hydrolyzing) [Ketogulonicigenium vulgare WSH-001]ALJ81246.1 5-oxoprolinase [Ketogulonicigenium vulgare]ANW33988.1 5-oxoprolinase [Ketogulonicigenium vulgare]AOZ54829.1 N-methylhydantoinase B [Ketogulonicigenium vulgare]
MSLNLIDKQIMWNRLLAVVEEQAQVCQRTAFSTIVRESGDLAAGVFDAQGRMLAQAVTGTPGHINSMALAVGHVIAAYPQEVMREGDVYIHNDPWMGTGHLNDISITTPCFYQGKLVGFLACNSHIMDIGGLPDRTASTDVFMEGLYLPILKIADAGEIDESLMAVIRANTRQPVETVGDVYSLINCNAIGCERLVDMMAEFQIDALDELADHVIDTSREAVMAKIRELPKGTWHGTLMLDGMDDEVLIKAALTIDDDGVHVDYAGSAGMVKRNFNVPLCYTLAYTSYALGVALFGDIPNNAGSLAPRHVTAPAGSILNALKPAAVFARSQVGLMLPDVVYNCLRQAIPDRIPAESTCGLWGINVMGPWSSPAQIWNRYRVQIMTTGGMGALPFRDGMSATGFPSGVRGGPVEVFESMSTLVIWRKEFLPDSGGAGEYRGGLGQWIEMENSIPEPFDFFAGYERIKNPAKGAFGGMAGGAGSLELTTGLRPGGKDTFAIPAGERLTLKSSGGGGTGDPAKRDRAAVARDLECGLISADAARDIYGLQG